MQIIKTTVGYYCVPTPRNTLQKTENIVLVLKQLKLSKLVGSNAKMVQSHCRIVRQPPWCPSTGEWLTKLWYIHTKEFYSATERYKLPINATTVMDSTHTTLSKEVRHKRLNDSMYGKFWNRLSWSWGPKTDQCCLGAGQGAGADRKEARWSFWRDANVLCPVVVGVIWVKTFVKTHRNTHLEWVFFTQIIHQ